MKVLYAWDFHGTLEEGTIKQAKYITNKIRREKGIPILNEEDISSLFGEHWLLWFKYKTNITTEEAEEMYKNAQKIAHNTIKRFVKPKKYSFKILKHIKETKGTNIVVSNTKLHKLHEYTIKTGLEKYFDYFIGNDDIKPYKEKVDEYKYKKVKKYLKNKNFKKIICIGDQETDIKLGIKLKNIIPTITYRVYTHKKPENSDADFLINDLRKVLKKR